MSRWPLPARRQEAASFLPRIDAGLESADHVGVGRVGPEILLLGNAVAFGSLPKQFIEWVVLGGLFLVFLPILIEKHRLEEPADRPAAAACLSPWPGSSSAASRRGKPE